MIFGITFVPHNIEVSRGAVAHSLGITALRYYHLCVCVCVCVFVTDLDEVGPTNEPLNTTS